MTDYAEFIRTIVSELDFVVGLLLPQPFAKATFND